MFLQRKSCLPVKFKSLAQSARVRPCILPLHASPDSSYPSSAQPNLSSTAPASDGSMGTPGSNGVHPATPAPPPSLWQRVKEYFLGSKEEKSRLASLGMGAFASYGVISNVTYGACLTISWIAFIKATGTTPLQPGQWKPFLAFYAGLWTVQNFVRPARFALAVALAPSFDRLITSIGQRLHVRKPVAFGLFLTCMAIITSTTLFTAIWAFGGFPDGLPFFTKTA